MSLDAHDNIAAVADEPSPITDLGTPGSFLSRPIAALSSVLARDGLALALFAVMSLAAMYPVVPEFRSRVLGWLGDNALYAYMTGWTAQSLLLRRSPFIDPRLNYPDSLALPANDAPFLSMLSAAPATWLLGPTFSYNLIILLSHLLSGYIVYRWIVSITGSRAAGVITGAAFLLAPFRIVKSYGHLNLVGTYPLPLFFWALDRALQPPAPQWRAVLLLGAATCLVGSTSQYYLIMCLVTGIGYALLTLLPRLVYIVRYGWRFIAGVGVGAAISALPYFSVLGSNMYQPYNLSDTRQWSADPINFLLPSHLHPLWGGVVDKLRPEPLWGEKTVYIGLVAGLLGLLALCWPKSVNRRRNYIWLGVALIAAVFALGIDLHLNNRPVQATDPVWLPAYYLARLPLIGLVRVWSRFGIITILFVALLAGVGAAHLAAGLRRWRWPTLALVGALLALDLLPGNLHSTSLLPRPVDRWLARQPGDFAVAFLPAGDEVLNYQSMFGSLFHAKHLPAFVHWYHRPKAYQTFSERAATFPQPRSIQALRGMGLRYLLLDRRLFNGRQAADWSTVEAVLSRSPNARIVADLDGIVVVALR